MVLKELQKNSQIEKINWINDDNDILYDQYGFDQNGLNKDGLNKYGYQKFTRKRFKY